MNGYIAILLLAGLLLSVGVWATNQDNIQQGHRITNLEDRVATLEAGR